MVYLIHSSVSQTSRNALMVRISDLHLSWIRLTVRSADSYCDGGTDYRRPFRVTYIQMWVFFGEFSELLSYLNEYNRDFDKHMAYDSMMIFNRRFNSAE